MPNFKLFIQVGFASSAITLCGFSVAQHNHSHGASSSDTRVAVALPPALKDHTLASIRNRSKSSSRERKFSVYAEGDARARDSDASNCKSVRNRDSKRQCDRRYQTSYVASKQDHSSLCRLSRRL